MQENADTREIAWVIADTETTGLNGPACEVALREINPDTLDVIDEIQSLIDPECEIEPGATEIHGITDAMVANAPTLQEFIDTPGYLDRRYDGRQIVLIAHNAPFDYKRLVALGDITTSICTYFHARQMWPKGTDGLENHKLGTLREHFGFPTNEAHRAMADVATTHRLLREILGHTNRGLRDFMATQDTTIHRMPFGKHVGKLMIDVPLDYLLWLKKLPDLETNLKKSVVKAIALLK